MPATDNKQPSHARRHLAKLSARGQPLSRHQHKLACADNSITTSFPPRDCKCCPDTGTHARAQEKPLLTLKTYFVASAVASIIGANHTTHNQGRSRSSIEPTRGNSLTTLPQNDEMPHTLVSSASKSRERAYSIAAIAVAQTEHTHTHQIAM